MTVYLRSASWQHSWTTTWAGEATPTVRRQLAARLGMRAETLSRLFADWSERGYVTGRLRSWRILAPAVLTELSSGAVRHF